MIYCFIGIPGSGKTYLAKQYQKQFGGLLLDDKYTQAELIPALNYNIFIADPYLCKPEARDALIAILPSGTEIKWFFFENNTNKALNNIHHRNDGRTISAASINNYWSKIYKIPDDVIPISIWQDSK